MKNSKSINENLCDEQKNTRSSRRAAASTKQSRVAGKTDVSEMMEIGEHGEDATADGGCRDTLSVRIEVDRGFNSSQDGTVSIDRQGGDCDPPTPVQNIAVMISLTKARRC